MTDDLDWDGGVPRSRRFGDIYFSPTDGLAESRAVFLDGCGLPEAWAGRRRFTVFELGFGTGLNVLALLDLWRRARPEGGRLSIVSVEAFPLAPEEARRALDVWPELGDLAERLLARWPAARGWRRIDLSGLGATLDVAVAEAAEALSDWRGLADAWFLDGFAPSKNPEMWREEVLELIAARSAPGARLASFTVAGAVRRGLEARGFTVERPPGFGRKKQRLEAWAPGAPPDAPPPPSVAVVGAGIAGAALARAFRALGAEAVVVEAEAAAAGASGNPAALVTPWLDAGFGPAARLHAQALIRAVDLYRSEVPEAVIATVVDRLVRSPKDAERFARIAGWDGFPPGAATLEEGVLRLRPALVVEPAAILARWLGVVRRAEVARLEPAGAAWRLIDPAGAVIVEADLVCIAAGHAARRLLDLPLSPVRGQASWSADLALEEPPAAWGGYAVPMRGGVLFGATHDRGEEATDVRTADHARNLALLAEGRPALAARLDPAALRGRAGIRAATADHLPLAGPAAGLPGVFMLAGLGGRGFTLAPLLAEAVAAEALGAPSPLPAPLLALVDPARFQTRPSGRRLPRGAKGETP